MATCEPDSSVGEAVKLSELLDGGWRILEEADSASEPPGQQRLKLGLSLLQEAAHRVEQLGLFSRNEALEEVCTADLKYLLLPALLGALSLKQSSPENRLQTVRTAREHFWDFLTRCKNYDVTRFELPERTGRSPGSEEGEEGASTQLTQPGPGSLVSMAAQRQAKIARYRQKKDLEARLSAVRAAVEGGQADDEVSRDFYLTNAKRWITISLDELESIEQEERILANMATGKSHKQPAQPSRPPMKPFILTKDAMQARVFGAGYPSLPTMTVDDWYEQHRRRGVLPDQGAPARAAAPEDSDRQEEGEEEKTEEEEQEALTRARTWDDWKDDHRRGYGNRHNMG